MALIAIMMGCDTKNEEDNHSQQDVVLQNAEENIKLHPVENPKCAQFSDKRIPHLLEKVGLCLCGTKEALKAKRKSSLATSGYIYGLCDTNEYEVHQINSSRGIQEVFLAEIKGP